MSTPKDDYWTLKFKYLWIIFTSNGNMERELDWWMGAVPAVMWALYPTGEERDK